MSHSLQPRGLQHARLPCPTLSTGTCSNSCSLSGWCHPSTSSSAALFSSCPHLSQHQGLFQWVGSSHQVVKYWRWSFSFSISPSSEYSGLISFMTDWFDLLDVQGTLKSLLKHHTLKASILWAKLSLWSHSHTCTWQPENLYLWLYRPLSAKWCFCFLTCYLGLSQLLFQRASAF